MRRKTLKMLALVITTVMTLTILSACSGTRKESTDKSASTTANTQTTIQENDPYAPKEDKVYEISYVTTGTSAVEAEKSKILKSYNDTFNVKLKPIFFEPAQFEELLNLTLASNDIPDVWIAQNISSLWRYQEQGLLSEVKLDIVEKYAPDLFKCIDRDAKDAWQTSKYKGKNYGIPLINASYMFRDAIAWRTDWLKNVGIDKIPETIEEWENALLKFRNDDPDKNDKKDTYGCSTSIFAPVSGAFGTQYSMWWSGSWVEEDEQAVYTSVSPKMKDTLALLNKWYKMEIIDPEFVTGENKGGYWAVSTDFVNGRIGVSAMGYYYHWYKEKKASNGEVIVNPGSTAAEFTKNYPNGTFEFGNPPIGSDGKSRGMMSLGIVPGNTYVFSKNLEEEPDKFGKILQMFNWPQESFENHLFAFMGIEGEQYTVRKIDNYTTYVQKLANEYTEEEKKLYSGTGQFFLQNDIENYRKQYEILYDTAVKNGFNDYKLSHITNRLFIPSQGKLWADLNKMEVDAYVNIITGKKPISYFDEFVANWKAAGGDQILKEANESFNNSK
ncbi:MAG TPA: hypothetical protein PK733_01735 [Clostridiales bacterium]|nr:hypothetical protein [Clostridiales bacterium]